MSPTMDHEWWSWPRQTWWACCTCSWSGPGTAPAPGRGQTRSVWRPSPQPGDQQSVSSSQSLETSRYLRAEVRVEGEAVPILWMREGIPVPGARRSVSWSEVWRDGSPGVCAVGTFEGAAHQQPSSVLVLNDAVGWSQVMPQLQSIRFIQGHHHLHKPGVPLKILVYFSPFNISFLGSTTLSFASSSSTSCLSFSSASSWLSFTRGSFVRSSS